MRPGDVFYARIGTLPQLDGRFGVTQRSYGDTFIVHLRDPASGAYEIQGLRLTG